MEMISRNMDFVPLCVLLQHVNRTFCRVMILELSATSDSDIEASYYNCSDFPFNFKFLQVTDINATSVNNLITDWMQHVQDGKLPNWVVS